MRVLRLISVILYVMIASGSAAYCAADANSKSIFDQDVSKGLLTPDQSTVYKALAIVRPSALPLRYQKAVTGIDKCGTDQIVSALSVIKGNPQAYKDAAGILQARPQTQKSYLSPQAYFILHYDTTGGHAVDLTDNDLNGVPDFIQRAAIIADSAWNYEVNDLGYDAPPTDGFQGGGIGTYDIYFQVILAYGFTSPEAPGGNSWNDYSSFITVHSNFIGFPPNNDPEGNILGALKVTIAHEFFHAVQFAYNVGAESFFMEQSSVWMEDMSYDNVNDNYNYLPYFYSNPEIGLMKGGINRYASFVWVKFLQEKYGTNVIRSLWTACRDNSAVGAWQYVLDTMHVSLSGAFLKFVNWNFYTGANDDGHHFEEAANYPVVQVMRVSDVIPDSNEVSISPPEPLASNYIIINNFNGYHGMVNISFTGVPTATWGIAYAIDYGSSVVIDTANNLLQNGAGKISIGHFENVLRVILMPATTQTYGGPTNYVYHVYFRVRGDVNGDDFINISDATAGISYIFGGGAAPNPIEAMDANCDGIENISDIIFIINYIFGGGPAPCPS